MRFCGGCGAALTSVCKGCGAESPPEFAFCGQCGAALAPELGPELQGGGPADSAPPPERSPRDYTPRHLAEHILRQRSALEGERKHVTVLFADVKGSMDIAERVDPEAWHRILDGFFQILTEGIHRFEGTVNQYTGDGVMALFGAPLAHEDHAQRACFAALRLRAAIEEYADELRRQGHSFAVRIGLNSGEVVVGKIGDDLRMDYTALGHTVGLAARIQTLTAPGRVCLSGETARLVEGYFKLRDLGRTRVKGVTDPVGLFELEDVGALRTRLERSRARGFTRFVGRDDELQMLDQALERANAGQRQIVGVVGEAGIGKSRLCAEFVERARARGIPVYAAHCPPHGQSLSGVGARELIQSFFAVSEHDPPAEARRKIAGTLVLLNPSFQEMLPLVFEACGVPDRERPSATLDPALRRQRTVAFLRELLQARSARECALFLLDDLHWADPETDLLISQIVETATGTRTMVLGNFRPEYEAGWMESSDYIPLRALTTADSARLVDTLLGADPSLAPLRARILERAGGNPFFAEELVQSMVEADVLEGDRGDYRLRESADEIAVPKTVHAVLAARIDRLPEREKELLQAAAVVGREFSEAVLAAVLGRPASEIADGLAALRAGDFVVEEAVYPEIEYAFKHPLTHEVAYRTQLGSRRASLHGASAAALAERGADPALIAQHFEQAGDALAAAQRFAEAAGEFAHRDPDPADRCWRKVRALCTPLPDPEARALHERAISQILLAAWTAEIEIDEAQVETLEEAAPLVVESQDFELFAMIQQRLGWAHLMAGDIGRCQEVTDAALARCGPDRAKAGRLAGYGSQLFMLAQRAYARGLQGHFREAEEGLLEALRLGLEDDDHMILCSVSGYQSVLASLCGDLDEAEAAARRGLEYSERGLGDNYRVLPLLSLASVLVTQNRGEELCEIADALESLGWIPGDLAPAIASFRSMGLFRRGRIEDARAQLERIPILEDDPSPERLYGLIHSLSAQHQILGGAGQAKCDEIIARAQSLIDSTDLSIFQPELDLQRADLARARGDEETWRTLLHDVRRVFEADGRSLRVAAIDAALRS
ncbi:MAG: AAA family ATPase [Deltaproteobacteria bacterium]|nr:AAA family ATPase [Deltaproteobacteria bacterium]